MENRFWTKVDKTKTCWNWLGSKSSKGYGRFKIKGKLYSPHRISYELINGPIPKGMFICHKCDNPACVNPGHLFLGTQSDNMKDCFKKGRGVTNIVPRFKKGDIPYNQEIKNPDEIRKIKIFIKENYPKISLKEIAFKLGISYKTIRNVKRGYINIVV
ncbi:MAG: HNH endonuclease [Candidatus Paceibacterota bacterium]|jgi:hypothetical protein